MRGVEFGWCFPYANISSVQDRSKAEDARRLREVAEECEKLGYASIWYVDHFFIGYQPDVLECWTTLSFLAGATEKIKVGSIVLCNLYRNPSLVAKMGATLDVLSGGRLILGLGAGWKEDEFKAYGYKFPNARERILKLSEGIDVIRAMWTQENPSFTGRYYRIRDAICKPKPIQKPHPPIMVGGGGEKLTLRVVAEKADIWNYLRGDPELYERKLKILREHCSVFGRNIEDIGKSWFGRTIISDDERKVEEIIKERRIRDGVQSYIAGTPSECTNLIQKYIDLGVNLFILTFQDYPSMEGTRLFAREVMPNFE